MRSNQLLYLLYGDKASYRHEAKFSILSALRHRRDAHSFTVTVMTDQPAEFAGWPVDVVPLDAQTLAAWVGAGGYHHRRKACAIQAGAQLAETTIFIDTDTVFVKDPAALFGRVSEDRFLMDEFEMLWAEASQRNEYEAFALELAQYNQLPVPGLRLFNSGVCGLTRSNAHLFADVIALIDRWAHHGQMLFTLEQVVVSMVLRDKKVVEANDCVHHYYAVKRFYHAMLEVFFERHGEVFRDELLGLSDQVPNRLPRNSLADRLRMKWVLRGCGAASRKVAKFYFLGKNTKHCAYLGACRSLWWEKALEELKVLEAEPRYLNALRSFWRRDHAFLAFAAERNVRVLV
ncbi:MULTISPECIES: hypothetical protein [Pseudomonas]|uniref:Nucleotide-diphospho-sugar transferase domain-containing protein n=1 Tax=Pseudomonas sp. Hg7Tf TaxID=3236988 RepID=A0AB39HTB4_9PSED|nr:MULTISPECIES: hypothetical protein [unclassified Pseudomonas]MDH2558989.1 hypothetical protein [Pseudomonas sp. Hg5Tf]